MPRVVTRIVAALLGAALATGLQVAVSPAPASAKIWKVTAPDLSLDPLVQLNEYENRVVYLVNKRRKKRDLRPVRYFTSCLDRLSERWAAHLAETGELVHRNQKKVLTKCDLAWTGETLASGTGMTPSNTVTAWMHSKPHRQVLMKPRARRAGTGVKLDSSGKFFVVLNFGDPA